MAIRKKHNNRSSLRRNNPKSLCSKGMELRGLESINPKPLSPEVEAQFESYLQEYENDQIHGQSTVIPTFDNCSNELAPNCKQALYELLNLENRDNYLSDKLLSGWKSALDDAKLFYRLLIYISINMELPATKDMNQGQYFSEYFGIESYNVTKTLKYTEMLVFLYLGKTNFNQIKDLNLLMSIGNENDYALQNFIDVHKQHGEAFLINVFHECQEEVKSKSAVKKITGTLITAVATSHAKQLELAAVTEHGAFDHYTTVEQSSDLGLIAPTNKDAASAKSNIDITELISSIKCQEIALSKLANDKDKYSLNEIDDVLNAIKELQELASSLSQ
jgi:hypothetical protein